MQQLSLRSGFGLGGFLPDALPPNLRDLVRHPTPSLNEDERWMLETLRLAMPKAADASPNPCVGAVFVKDQQLLGGGATDPYGGKHGERLALAACQNTAALRGATLYVSLEPCTHQGKQPPCVDALRDLGLARCVIATSDPHPLVQGNGIKQLKAEGMTISLGVLAAEMRAWHLPFLAQLTRQRPLFVGKWAQTLNGLLADDQGQSQWLSGPSARAYTHHLRHRYDAIMVGSQTVLRDRPRLSVRDVPYAPRRQPLKILCDPQGRLLQRPHAEQEDIRARLHEHHGRVVHVVFATNRDTAAISAETKGNHWLTLRVAARPSLSEALSHALQSSWVTQFHGKPLQSILVEGGPRLLNLLWQEGAMDMAHVFIVPALAQGERYRLPGFAMPTPSPSHLSLARMQPLAFNQLGDDLVWEMLADDLARRYFTVSPSDAMPQ